ncbi:transport and Golgi organization protein 2 [Uranotaenia lowii]|uniref:transport and Golgi organization protein 2 n=1 Tax=Uranotaenia lowii TaxID=190385 RepID=UPI00247A6B89|nr:transport and Golgi organization protein 2 [Uranotaenia lowii]XP_055612837.1 transport and Golgi organization protein 2 [Uranotaenia lowii]
MCILFIFVNNNGKPIAGQYRLIVASNRDEYYARPALEAGPWVESPHVIGGRDMEPGREGGTWLGASGLDGIIKVGALLNVTGDSKPNVTVGRGPIVANYLSGSQTNVEYSKGLLANDNYGPFNFVSVQLDRSEASVMHASNSPHKIDNCPLDGALGFGNSTLDVPLQKVRYGRKRFEELVGRQLDVNGQDELVEDLLQLLSSNEKYFPDAELSRRAPDCAEMLAHINVRHPSEGYGSRTRTVILVDHENRMDFIEETMVGTNPDGEWKRTHLQRQW